jgi:hypothetical protein
MNFYKWISDVSKSIQGIACAIVMILGIIAIFSVIILIIKYVKIRPFDIILSTIGGCIFMIPTIWAFNNFVEAKVGMNETQRINRTAIVEQNIKIQELENTIKNLEYAKFNVNGFERIMKLGLLEVEMTQTAFYQRGISDAQSRFFGLGGYENMEYLGVAYHDIKATYGIDLRSIRISTKNENTIIVSNIEPIFMGTSKNNTRWILSEIRKLVRDNNGKISKTDIIDTRETRGIINDEEREILQEYQERLHKGLETAYLNVAVIELAKNFIKTIFLTLNKEIEFDNDENSNALPLLDFINQQLVEKEVELKNTINIK